MLFPNVGKIFSIFWFILCFISTLLHEEILSNLIYCNNLRFRDVVELLVRSDARLDIGANTPLMEAAQEGHLDTVRFILNEMRSLGLPVSFFLTRSLLPEVSGKFKSETKVLYIY